MSRPTRIACAFLATVVAIVTAAAVLFGRRALSAGRELYEPRLTLERDLAPPAPAAPLVVWVGDSTLDASQVPSYPQVLAPRLRAHGIESRVLATPGLDFYGYYFVMTPVLRLRPALVVMVANLRLLDPRGAFDLLHTQQTFRDLASMLPLRELPRALALPLEARGLTVPRLLLLQLFELPGVETAVLFLEGWRAAVQQQIAAKPIGPRGAALQSPEVVQHFLDDMMRRYDTPLDAAQPVVRMAAAAVELATRRAVPVLVVVSPIPVELLRDRGLYEAGRYASRLAALREAVERRGGTFLDLHDRLAAADFRDPWGHFTPGGAERLAERLEPVVLGRVEPERQPGAPEPALPATTRAIADPRACGIRVEAREGPDGRH